LIRLDYVLCINYFEFEYLEFECLPKYLKRKLPFDAIARGYVHLYSTTSISTTLMLVDISEGRGGHR